VWTGSSLITTSVGENGDILFWWQASGKTKWNEEVVAKPDPSNGIYLMQPSIAWTGSEAAIAVNEYSGDGSGLEIWTEVSGSTRWNPVDDVQLVNGGAEVFTPQIAWTGSNLVVTGESGGSLYFWYQDSSGAFLEQQVAAATESDTYSQPTITATNGAVVILAILNGTNIEAWYQPFGDSGTPWPSDGLGGGNSQSRFEGPSVTWTGSQVIAAVEVQGTNADVEYLSQSAPGQPWSNTGLPNPSVPSGEISWAGNAAINWTPNSNAVITATDSADNTLYFWWQSAGTANFHVQTVTAPGSSATVGTTPAITSGSDAVVISDYTSDGLYRYAQEYATKPWRPQLISP
jgi:hypothetical protein